MAEGERGLKWLEPAGEVDRVNEGSTGVVNPDEASEWAIVLVLNKYASLGKKQAKAGLTIAKREFGVRERCSTRRAGTNGRGSR